jgi:hypothetical protein
MAGVVRAFLCKLTCIGLVSDWCGGGVNRLGDPGGEVLSNIPGSEERVAPSGI